MQSQSLQVSVLVGCMSSFSSAELEVLGGMNVDGFISIVHFIFPIYNVMGSSSFLKNSVNQWM